jgi:hypothetical protein
MPLSACNRLLVMLTVQVLHQPRQPLDGTADQIGYFLDRLRAPYAAAVAPFGDDARGFQRWLLDQWPAPPMA